MHLLKKNFPLGFRIGVIGGYLTLAVRLRKQENRKQEQEAGSKSRKQERRSRKQEAGLTRATAGMQKGVHPSISIVT